MITRTIRTIIADLISEVGGEITIKSVNISSDSGKSYGTLTLFSPNRQHLNTFLSKFCEVTIEECLVINKPRIRNSSEGYILSAMLKYSMKQISEYQQEQEFEDNDEYDDDDDEYSENGDDEGDGDGFDYKRKTYSRYVGNVDSGICREEPRRKFDYESRRGRRMGMGRRSFDDDYDGESTGFGWGGNLTIFFVILLAVFLFYMFWIY